jgi:hypothetical protein
MARHMVNVHLKNQSDKSVPQTLPVHFDLERLSPYPGRINTPTWVHYENWYTPKVGLSSLPLSLPGNLDQSTHGGIFLGSISTFVDPFQTKCSNFNTCFLRTTVAQIIQVHLQSCAYAVFDAKNLVSFEQDFVISTPKHDPLSTRSSQDGIIDVHNVDWCN